jgi:hypothetical protein
MWAQLINAALGVWLMAAPSILGYDDPARTNDQIVGPLAATVAVIAWWEVTRSVRWINVLLGLWLLVSPWVLGYGDAGVTLHSFAIGTPLALLAVVQGKSKHRFGGGWSALFTSRTMHDEP